MKKPHLVVMTIISTICSHTMRQKSTKVFGKGPEGHKGLSGNSNFTTYHSGVLSQKQVYRKDCTDMLTLSGDVSVTPLVPIHETGINVI